MGNTSYIDIVNWPHVKSGALRAQKHQQNETEPIKRNNWIGQGIGCSIILTDKYQHSKETNLISISQSKLPNINALFNLIPRRQADYKYCLGNAIMQLNSTSRQ